MKKPLKNLSLLLCILSLSLQSQISSKTTSGSVSEQLQTDPADAKANYIKAQSYLSASTLKDYKNYFGDSLKGFDEAAVKVELLSHLYYGQEFINVMNFRKRDFIDSKYKIGPYSPKLKPIIANKPNTKTIGGGNTINVAPCVNEDFESTTPGTYTNVSNAVTGWTVESTSSLGKQLACGTPTNATWVNGSPEFSIVSTPILNHPHIGNIPNSPLGGNNVAVLNDIVPGFTVTRISTTFPVTSANSLFQFAYAGSWNGSGHNCCDQPFFTIDMYDCNGAPLSCSSISLTPPGTFCQNGATGYSVTPVGQISWTNWQLKSINLTAYIGTCVTLRITNGDCNGGAHHASLYFDAKCGGSLLCSGCSPPQTSTTTIGGPVSFCAGSGVAQIAAPIGYASYSWTAPPNATPLSASQSTSQIISINNPTPGTVYTVNLVTPSGCLFVSTNTIMPSLVSITGIGSDPSCTGGSSGAATVVANGSGAGYNYTWLNSTNSVVSTASVATGLLPGIYSVVVTGFGAAGCGSAVATATIGTAPPGVTNIFKPFCGTTAYLITNGGSNFQWYNGALSPIAGANASSITISNPSTGSVVTVTYTGTFGCRDSVRYTLAANVPGFLNVNNISWICPGGNNGTAVVNLIPTAGSPTGQNLFSIISTGTTSAYNIATGPSAQTSLSLTGLSAGSYSVNSFDGSCHYNTTFNVNAFTFTYAVSPASATLCPGNSIPASLSFSSTPSLSQYSYSWSPTTWLAGNNGSYISTIISPTVSVGTSSTVVYTIVVTPSTVNCPVVKTITITAINPPIPTITVIPDLCNTSAPYQIITSPSGGTFGTGFQGLSSPISQSGGIITPSHTNIALGTNTFVYSITVNTCSASKTGSYQVSQFNSSALTSNVPSLCVTNPPFNLMNIVQNTVNGNWSGNGVSGNQFVSANLVTGNYPIVYTIPSNPNPLACPSNTTINVSVTNTLIPFIALVPEFCNNAPPITMTVNPGGGTWLANTGISSAGIITPSNINVPNLVVTYTVATGPCLNVNSTTLHISQFISATLTGTVPNLCYNSNTVSLMSIVQNTTGTWSGPNGFINNSFVPSGLTTGIYEGIYQVNSYPNANLCPDSKTIAISVLNPDMPVITQMGPICNKGNAIQLTVSPANGQWTGTPYLSATGLLTPSLASVGNNPIQYIIGTATCNRQQTKYISVEAFVPATIVSSLPDLCNTSAIMNLSPFTLNNQGIWSGEGITGSNFNPGVTGSGSFNLTYSTSSSPSSLCPDVASISVNVYSLATPAVVQAGPFCSNNLPVQLQVSPVGGLFGGSNTGIVSLQGKFNPASAIIGDNIVTYSITSGPCVAYAQTSIRVEKFVSASFEKNIGPFCKTDQAVNLNSYVQNPGGIWTGSGVTGTMFTPSKANTSVITYQTKSSPDGLCSDIAKITVEVRDIPVVNVVSNADAGCVPVEILFSTPNVNSGNGTWTINDGSEPVNGLTVSHLFTTPGIYSIQFNYADDIGCKANAATIKAITVFEVPKANFMLPEEIYISDPKVQLVNQSSILNNNTYKWKIENMNENNEVSPSVTFPKIGKYQIKLVATSLQGCTDEILKTIEVKNNFNVFIPNSFSPNFDGLNDIFIPVFTKEGIDTKSYEMEIFDRWGHLLFQTKDINKGWDGSTQNKDESIKDGMYVYKIKYKDAEGNPYEKIGNLTLLK